MVINELQNFKLSDLYQKLNLSDKDFENHLKKCELLHNHSHSAFDQNIIKNNIKTACRQGSSKVKINLYVKTFFEAQVNLLNKLFNHSIFISLWVRFSRAKDV